ncbi:tyrosine-type recombinase/integrase [Kocuria oceani]|uniref:tyrosine-type recombinase/integrase n=1 Tax=Kocuria oceani TaxID=988827 RepID=UPI0040367F8B
MDPILASAGPSNAERYRELLGAWLASYGSPHTRAAYRRDVRIFLGYLETTGLDLLAVRRPHLDVFARTRQATGDAPATLNRRLAAVSALYAYAVDDGVLTGNPAARVRRAAVDADHSTTAALTRREAEDLLGAAREHSPRAHALVDLLLSTGVRISEALDARLSALSADRLVITRKGGKTAVIPLPEHTVEALRGMAGTTGTELARGDEATGWLFATASGRSWARTDAAKLLTRLAQKAGIVKRVSPHVLRHTHATLALELGVPLHHLQDSLGHIDPRTTRRYDHTRSRVEHSSAHRVGALFG